MEKSFHPHAMRAYRTHDSKLHFICDTCHRPFRGFKRKNGTHTFCSKRCRRNFYWKQYRKKFQKPKLKLKLVHENPSLYIFKKELHEIKMEMSRQGYPLWNTLQGSSARYYQTWKRHKLATFCAEFAAEQDKKKTASQKISGEIPSDLLSSGSIQENEKAVQ